MLENTDAASKGPLYEQPFFRRSAGRTMRPGGERLTLRGLHMSGLLVEDAHHAHAHTRNGHGGWRAARSPLDALDVGCGAGATLGLLHAWGFMATGVEPSAALREEAHGWLPEIIPVLEGIASSLPVASASQDVVLCECVLSLLDEPGKGLALREVNRVLRPGGVLVWSDLFVRDEQEGRQEQPDHAGCLTGAVSCARMDRHLEEAGLKRIVSEDHSAALRQLVGQIMFDGGSEAWTAWLGSSATCKGGSGERTKSHFGYVLMIATKEGV